MTEDHGPTLKDYAASLDAHLAIHKVQEQMGQAEILLSAARADRTKAAAALLWILGAWLAVGPIILGVVLWIIL